MMAILAAVVLFLGYLFFGRVFGASCEVEHARFLESIEGLLDTQQAYGAVKTVELLAPCNTQRLCFIDARMYGSPVDGIYPGSPRRIPPVPYLVECPYEPPYVFLTNQVFGRRVERIMDAVSSETSTPSNVLIVDGDEMILPTSLFSGSLVLDKPCQPLCINSTSGRFIFRVLGEGRHIRVTEVP